MNEKKKKVLVAVGIILVILILIAVYKQGGFKTFVSVPTECSGGTTILSIDKALVTTSTDLKGKEVVRVTAVANGGGECLRIGWNSDKIKEELKESGQNYDVDNSVFGDLITKSQTQAFTVNSYIDQKIYKVSQGIKKTGSLCSISNCEIDYDNVIYLYRKYGPVGDCYCVFRNLYGGGGAFAGGSVKDFDVTFKIEGQGETNLKLGKQSGLIGDKAFIKWSGDLMSGYWLGTPPDYDSFSTSPYSTWRMARDGFYDDIADRYEEDTKDAYDSKYKGCLIGGLKRVEGYIDFPYEMMKSCLEQYNSFVDLKTEDKDFEWWTGEDLVKDFDWNGNKLVVNLATFTTWQIFTIDLDASWVGIHKNTGIPEVKCPAGRQDVISGKQVTSNFQVKDTAGTNPSFGLSLDCSSGLGSLQQSRINNVGTSFQNVKGYVTLSTTEDVDFSCEFKAYDLNDPNSEDSCVANYKGKSFTGCVANTEKICSSDAKQIGTCNAQGTDFIWVKCEFGCEPFGGSYRCSSIQKEICDNGIDDDGDGLIDIKDPDCNKDCKSCNDWLMNIFRGKEKECTPTSVIETKWYNPLTWIGLTGLTDQSKVCPIYFGVIGLIVLIVLFIVMIILFGFSVIALIIKSIFKRK